MQNVQPLQSKVPSFSDETLLYIFYTMPRDIMQEIVAQELYVPTPAPPSPDRHSCLAMTTPC